MASVTRQGADTAARDRAHGRGRACRASRCWPSSSPGPSGSRVFVDHPAGRRPRALRARHERARATTCASTPSTSPRPGIERPLRTPAALPQRRRPPGRAAHARRASARPRRGRRARASAASRSQTGRRVAWTIPYEDDRAGQPDRRRGEDDEPGDHRGGPRDRAREGHRERHARRGARGRPARRVQEDAGRRPPRVVELDDEGDFRVFSIELPADLEERLLDEARERALDELERLEEENGERSHTLSPTTTSTSTGREVPEEQIKREDVTPENFGRIAAQTAKQVILQRIREAERADDVRRVRRPRQRGRHRHRPAGRRPQQRARRPRQGRGAAAALRAGRRRALRAGLADQGRHHRGALRARRARR